MFRNLLFFSVTILLILDISNPLEIQAEKTKNSLFYKFCIATLKSKFDIKNKENFKEISHFTCECFLKKYKSGNSLKRSRIYCKDKASKKYDL